MDVDGIGIYEPCNSASNLAYYRTALGVCDHDQWSMDDVRDFYKNPHIDPIQI
jgi:hypothetical protein